MMPRSPIPEKFWHGMFVLGFTTFTGAMAYSFYRQHSDARTSCPSEWTIINAPPGTHPTHELVKPLQKILQTVQRDRQSRKGSSLLAVHDNVQGILQHMTDVKDKDDSSSTVCSLCVQIVITCFLKERETRTLFANAGGYITLVGLLAMAHQVEDIRVVDICAAALREATDVEESEVVLPTDIPDGCEGSYQLAKEELFPHVLRTLKPNARVKFLTNMAGAISNITMLRAGAHAISRGTDDKPGLPFLLVLLNHKDNNVIANAMRTVSALVYHCHKDANAVQQAENLAIIATHLSVEKVSVDPKILANTLRVLEHLYKSEFKASFLMSVINTDVIKRLISLWVSDVPGVDKNLRTRAERLMTNFSVEESTGPTALAALKAAGPLIQARRQKDQQEEAEKKQMERQRMMQQQMYMQEMMGGGQLPPQLAAMMQGAMDMDDE